ncbi:MAG: hypothetical protein IPM66_05775 [Acidobacteriota bacterium]|nr:MAG: hypothetical protein IPM66_05775 [Acidobacteriota bacterium]
MDCIKFQDTISEYLDGTVDSRTRAECAAHRLMCRECRGLFNEVRQMVQALRSISRDEVDEPAGLENRIIAATTAGEMLSCGDFDRLIENFFDGVILAPTFQTFQAHFEKCAKCRRLMGGIEEAIDMCHEIKETEVDVPETLHDRIVAATVGATGRKKGLFRKLRIAALGVMQRWYDIIWTPQMAAAALIVSASGLLILSRFGSVSGMAVQAGSQAEILVSHGQRALNQTEAMARTGFRRVSYEVNTLLFDGGIDNRSNESEARREAIRPERRAPETPPERSERQHHRQTAKSD